MSARSRMQHRLFLQRNTSGQDAYGGKGVPEWEALSTAPGYVWYQSGYTNFNNVSTYVLAILKAIAPLSTDVKVNDRIEKVEDRAGNQLFGPMEIDAILRRKDHFELRFKESKGC